MLEEADSLSSTCLHKTLFLHEDPVGKIFFPSPLPASSHCKQFWAFLEQEGGSWLTAQYSWLRLLSPQSALYIQEHSKVPFCIDPGMDVVQRRPSTEQMAGLVFNSSITIAVIWHWLAVLVT
jgi:hypothetical protein